MPDHKLSPITAAMALGLPLAPAYLEAKLKGLNMLKGINFASAAAGILDETGANYVTIIRVLDIPSSLCYF